MTAAVIALSILAASLGAALLVYAERFVTARKERDNAARDNDRAALQIEGLAASVAEHRERAAAHLAEIAALNAELAAERIKGVAGRTDADLRGVVNGSVLPDPGSQDPDPSGADAAVSAAARPGPFGAHGDELL